MQRGMLWTKHTPTYLDGGNAIFPKEVDKQRSNGVHLPRRHFASTTNAEVWGSKVNSSEMMADHLSRLKRDREEYILDPEIFCLCWKNSKHMSNLK